MIEIKKGTNKFYVEKSDKIVAKITFEQLDGDRIDVNHTFVSEELRGQGVAEQLLEHVIKYARENGKKIVPTCSYVKMRMERTGVYDDLLAK